MQKDVRYIFFQDIDSYRVLSWMIDRFGTIGVTFLCSPAISGCWIVCIRVGRGVAGGGAWQRGEGTRLWREQLGQHHHCRCYWLWSWIFRKPASQWHLWLNAHQRQSDDHTDENISGQLLNRLFITEIIFSSSLYCADIGVEKL